MIGSQKNAATRPAPTWSIASASAPASSHGTRSVSPASGPTPTLKTSEPTMLVP